MCGRYYIDDSIYEEMMELAAMGTPVSVREFLSDRGRRPKGDIHPADRAPVIYSREGLAALKIMRWGFASQTAASAGSGEEVSGRLIINARSESALLKPMFSTSLALRRCLIPASRFYEWDKEKNIAQFCGEKGGALYMAGVYDLNESEDRFVILTTQANESVLPIHPRMPLLLSAGEAEEWIAGDNKNAEKTLRKVPSPLKVVRPYEQMSLFG